MSNQLDEEIRKSVHYLRSAEKKHYCLPTNRTWMLPWDIDSIRLLWSDTHCPWSIDIKGVKEVVVSGDIKYKDPNGKMVIDIGDLFYLQFFSESDVGKIFDFYKTFGGRISGISSLYDKKTEIDRINSYCNKMDEIIVAQCNKLAKIGAKSIFQRLVVEMGGELIEAGDHLGQRVIYFRNISERYKLDKSRWHHEMLRLGLVSGK